MERDADAKRKLLKRIRHGKPTGAAQWTRVFVIVGAAIELSLVNDLVLREGRGSFGVLSTALVMVFISLGAREARRGTSEPRSGESSGAEAGI